MNEKRLFFAQILILMLLGGLSFSSCSYRLSNLYSANEASCLNVSEKNEARVSGAVSFEGHGYNGLNLQAAYSPVNHLVIGGNYFKTSGTNFENLEGNQSLYEGVIGIYYIVPPSKKQNRKIKKVDLILDVYAGYGLGENFNYFTPDSFAEFSFRHFFLQGGLHLKGKKYTLSYALKGLSLDFTKGKIVNDVPLFRFKNLENDPFIFFENTFQLKYQLKKIELYGSINGIGSPNAAFLYQQFRFHTGIIVKINELFQKKKTNSKN